MSLKNVMMSLLAAMTLTSGAAEPFAAPPKDAWKVELLKQPIRSFCIDFNWRIKGNEQSFAEPGHWADADPAEQVKWCKEAGVTCIQTFILSSNGRAWYKGGPVLEQPGLKHDFTTEVVRQGHREKMLVMGYYTIGANSLWGELHPDQSYGTPSWMHIPFTTDYIDYLCKSVEDALVRTGVDGFMLDWMINTSGKWLECEKKMYQELMGMPFPGADKITPADQEKFDELAVRRCWTRIRDVARRVKPDCILWPNGLNHLKLEGVDWLLNEGPDVETTEAARLKLNGRPVRLIQNQVGWESHDARKVFCNPVHRARDFYGFAAPYDNGLPLPVTEYLSKPVEAFKAVDKMTINDRNIAALIRFYLDKPVDPPPPWPEELRCEYLERPLGIDMLRPRLSWKVVISDQSAQSLGPVSGVLSPDKAPRGIKQAAYQVLVASSRQLLKSDTGDLWDSGKVESDQSVNVEYAGKPLSSGMQCFWKVRVWTSRTEGGDSSFALRATADRQRSEVRQSDWSGIAHWTMGMLELAGWGSATWIKSDLELFDYQKELKKMPDILKEKSWPMWERCDRIREMTSVAKEAPAVWLRKAFSGTGKPIKRAVAQISGLGFYELYFNGKRADDHYLNVAPYDFGKALPYQVQDVTHFISKGDNVVGVILGNGHFNPVIPCALREYTADYIDTPRMLFNLRIEYADGSVQHVVSDPTWKFTTGGPLRFNSLRSGEIYDARMELGDWSSTGYTAEGWKDALAAEPPAGKLVNQNLPPVRRIAEIPAVSVTKVDGKAHSVACTRLAEIPQAKDGAGYRFDIGVEATGWARLKMRGNPGQKILIRYPGSNVHTLGPYQECLYICKGGGEEIYEPRFAFNGYRYVDVFGLDYEPKVADVVGYLVVSDLRTTGRFSCSNPELNRIHEVVLRTILNYNIQMPMDPVREKSCWTQDVQSNFKATACNFDVSRIYAKWQEDFIRSVQADGFVPTVVPSCFDGPEINGPWWGGMIVFNPWQLYNFYGDRRILERSYEPMKHYMRYLDSIATNNIVSWGLGDWMDITAAGKHSKTCRPQNTTVPFTSTCAYMMYTDILRQTALLLNKSDEAAGFASRVTEIRAAINSRFFNPATGVYDKGSQTGYTLALLLDVPAKSDRMRVTENLRAQIVSDNYHITAGFVGIPFLLTYLTEHGMGDLAWKIATNPTYPGWFDMIFTLNNSVLKEDWAGKLVQMPSLAASIGEWFYRSLGGIRPDAPGFKAIIIQPYTETLDWVKCQYESPYGTIRSDWQKKDGKLTMEVTIPANTTATLYVPAKDVAAVTESGRHAAEAEGVKFLRMENGAAVYEVGSGCYQFTAR